MPRTVVRRAARTLIRRIRTSRPDQEGPADEDRFQDVPAQRTATDAKTGIT